MNGPVGVGVVGAGHISAEYLTQLRRFPDLRVVAIGDAEPERALVRAYEHDIPVSGDLDVVLGTDEVEIVVNLTTPRSHVPVSAAALAAGKHVWSEKPLGVDRAGARELTAAARAAGLRLGVAPDTVLGPGFQTARRALERGDIGRPLFAQTVFQWRGPELFHPAPAPFYAVGGGPVLDMGPYYLSALVHLFGPVAAVAAVGTRSAPNRRVEVGPSAGDLFPVDVPTSITMISTFESGGYAHSVYSTDSALLRQGYVEVTGTEGTLLVPDPNTFDGASRVIRLPDRLGDPERVAELPATGIPTRRGLGVLDLARALRAGRPHVASAELGYHVLDVLLAAEESAARGAFVDVASTVEAVASIDPAADPYALTL